MTFHNHILKHAMISLFLSGSLFPLSENWVKVGTAASTIAGAGIGYAITSSNRASHSIRNVGGTLGAVVGFFAGRYFLSKITPEGRYQRAVDRIYAVSWDGFFVSDINSYESLKYYLRSCYSTDWYLIDGKNHLNHLRESLTYAWSLLEAAAEEKKDNYAFVQLCLQSRSIIEQLRKKTDSILDLIESDREEYHAQRKHYDAYLERLESQARHADTLAQKCSDRINRERIEKEKMKQREKHHHQTLNVLAQR